MNIREFIDDLRSEGFHKSADIFRHHADQVSEIVTIMRGGEDDGSWRTVIGLDPVDGLWAPLAGIEVRHIRDIVSDKEHPFPPYLWPGGRIYPADNGDNGNGNGAGGGYNLVPPPLRGTPGCSDVLLAFASRGMHRSFAPTSVGVNLTPLYGLDFAEAMLGVIAVLTSCDHQNEETVLVTNDFSSRIFDTYYAPLIRRFVAKKNGRKFLVAEYVNSAFRKCAVVK